MDSKSPERDIPQPPRIHPPSTIRVLFATDGWPSGLLDVGSWAARRTGVEVRVLQTHGERDETLVTKLKSWHPHVVGFRVEGEPFEPLRRWIRVVRQVSEAEIVLGGPTATSHPIGLLRWSGADYVFAGEAEESFAQFLDLARQPHSRDLLPFIPGVAYRYGDRTFHNTLPADGYGRSVADCPAADVIRSPGKQMEPARTLGASLACLRNAARPIASGDTLAANRLDWSILESFDRPFDSLYFTGGRGCPGSCSFCAKLHGKDVRVKSAGQLLEEIEAADACVAEGRLHVTRWPLFAHVDAESLRPLQVSWAAIYDEDFFLDVSRAVEFFERWEASPLSRRYRLSVQTNPRTLLDRSGRMRSELLGWIDRVKPMVQLGAESFNPELLCRWHKRHTLAQLECVLAGLDTTGQDYTVFQLLTDFDTTAEELIETLRLLVLAGFAHRRMRIASSPYTIPLYDSDTRKQLEFAGRLPPRRIGPATEFGTSTCAYHARTLPRKTLERIEDFRDFGRPHPEWMDPLVAELADIADAQLHWTLNPETRDGALAETMPAVIEYLERSGREDRRDVAGLLERSRSAAAQIRKARFQALG